MALHKINHRNKGKKQTQETAKEIHKANMSIGVGAKDKLKF